MEPKTTDQPDNDYDDLAGSRVNDPTFDEAMSDFRVIDTPTESNDSTLGIQVEKYNWVSQCPNVPANDKSVTVSAKY